MLRKRSRDPWFRRLLNLIRQYWRQSTILISTVLIISLFFPMGKSLQYSYQLNDIARDPVIAPFTFPILKAEEKLQADLDEARKSVPYLFNRNAEVVESQVQAIRRFFILAQDIRQARVRFNQSNELVYRYRYEPQYADARADFRADSTALAVLMNTFSEEYSFPADQEPWISFLTPIDAGGPRYNLKQFENDIIQICRNRWAEGIYDISKEEIISDEVLVAQNENDVPTPVKPDEFNDLEEAWIKAKVEVTNLFEREDDSRRDAGYNLIVEFMQPNLIFDKETTERRRQARLDRVPRYQGTVLKDERIVDANQRITPDILQKLQSLSVAVSQREGVGQFVDKFMSWIGRVILIAVIISFFFTFLLIYRTYIYDDWKMVGLIALIFIAELGSANLAVLQFEVSEYLIPITVAAMSLTILFDARIGFMGTTSMAILSGIMMGNDLDFIVIAMFVSSVAMYNIRRLRTRSQLFSTIFALLAASVVVVVGLGLFKGYNWDSMQIDLGYLMINSVLAPIVTYGLIGLLEVAFGITTDLTLIELLDFDHPLLKRLQREANGTFNHSIVVGNLAEACADAIGVRSLLCRVGAYYHDIGKMTKPEYFIENQFLGNNRHDNLTPTMSAKIIKNHVKEGLVLADEYGIPKVVSDFIPMHHGTTKVEYFYRRALDTSDNPAQVDESAFRYPGPKPDTKETGILMICEAAEAAVRSIKDPDIIKIEEMLDKIIEKRITDGQLDECPLTLDELRRIKGTMDGNTGMLPVLRGIYHIRIEYPEDEPQPDPDMPAKAQA